MNYKQIENLYKNNGFDEYVLASPSDILKVHNIDVLTITGYDELTDEQKDLYKAFIVNFYNRWGLETRMVLKPIRIRYIKKREKKYMRFEYEKNGEKEWLHIVNENEWY